MKEKIELWLSGVKERENEWLLSGGYKVSIMQDE
jgi:hypothetical protein